MSEMNISGVGTNSYTSGVSDVDTKVQDTAAEQNNINDVKESKIPVSDENEQISIECTDGEDDGNIGVSEKLKAFGRGILNGISGLVEKKSSGWEKISERKQELTEQKQKLMQEALDITEQYREQINKLGNINTEQKN